MKLTYSGDIESLSSLVDRINRSQGFHFFPTNDITEAKLKDDIFQLNGMFCTGTGTIEEQNDTTTIDLKVRLKRQFTFIGIFVLIMLIGFIWSDNVTINGDSDPTIWKRIGFASIGFVIFSFPALILRKLRSDFERKVLELIK